MDPEAALWLNVLLRALLDLIGTQLNTETAHRLLIQQSARHWFSSTQGGPGSCKWICDAVGLDWATVRRRALELSPAEGQTRMKKYFAEKREGEDISAGGQRSVELQIAG